jgi:hypothetical protein
VWRCDETIWPKGGLRQGSDSQQCCWHCPYLCCRRRQMVPRLKDNNANQRPNIESCCRQNPLNDLPPSSSYELWLKLWGSMKTALSYVLRGCCLLSVVYLSFFTFVRGAAVCVWGEVCWF